MSWLWEPFTCAGCGLVRTALVAGLLVVCTATLVGTWVVLRGLTFLGDALAHGVLPGITTALLLGVDPALGAAVGAVVMVLGVELVHRRTRLPGDAGVGLLFVGMLALGVAIASRGAARGIDLDALLFGDILAVDRGDLLLAGGAAAAALLATLLGYRALLVSTLSPAKAELVGLRPRLVEALLLVLVATTVVTSFRAVGTLMVFAFLVAPPATGLILARRVPVAIAIGLIVGAAAVVVGLAVSFHWAVAAAPAVALVAVAEFFLALSLRELLRRRPLPADV